MKTIKNVYKLSSAYVMVWAYLYMYTYIAHGIIIPGITEGSVRETNTGDTYYSLVEVFYAGRWGTVCNTAWQLESAQVACRELGETPSLTEIPYYGFT